MKQAMLIRRHPTILIGLGWLLTGLIHPPVLGQVRPAGTRLDLSRAVVYYPATATGPEKKAVVMLVEETEKSSRIHLTATTVWPKDPVPVIVIGRMDKLQTALGKTQPLPAGTDRRAEGFSVRATTRSGQPVVWVLGNDSRGTVFGTGYLLRQLHAKRDRLTVDDTLNLTTAPHTALRGHQLGYRPKANSYDGWTLPMWEQYIRDLVVFGTNAIELIPPRSDDAPDSPHFPLPQLETMIGMSRIADEYGLDVWVWYPALDDDYGKPETVAFALKEWGEVLRKLPRLNAILVPCGDPGETPPELLMPMLEKQAAQLKQYHPAVQWWVSPQGFDEKQLATFRQLINTNPAWLRGVAYGPWMRMPLPEFRKWVPQRYPIRHYPDITHSHRCQYPVPDWDNAYVVTQHREPINPRPTDMATIFRLSEPHTVGYITYSEGCNDDVNKMVWSALGWNPGQSVTNILTEYSRYFVGDAQADQFAQGLLALERNWRGAVRTNAGIDSTLALFQGLEKESSPRLLLNWRFQQALFRAYYDAYIRQRLLYEQELEAQAMAILTTAQRIGATKAAGQAKLRLQQAEAVPVALPLKVRVLELGESLYQSIRMQLYVQRHKAGRPDGAMLERLDTPLNDRPWLLKQLDRITQQPSEEEKIASIQAILTRSRPNEGDQYDDLGDPARQPHLVRPEPYEQDPDFLHSPLMVSEQRSGKNEPLPLSWYSHALGLYDQPIRLQYDDLDKNARYKVRVVYAGGPVRLMANETVEIHPLLKKEYELLEFDLPADVSRSGKLTLSWTKTPGEGESGRGNQVSEVWLIKQ